MPPLFENPGLAPKLYHFSAEKQNKKQKEEVEEKRGKKKKKEKMSLGKRSKGETNLDSNSYVFVTCLTNSYIIF